MEALEAFYFEAVGRSDKGHHYLYVGVFVFYRGSFCLGVGQDDSALCLSWGKMRARPE